LGRREGFSYAGSIEILAAGNGGIRLLSPALAQAASVNWIKPELIHQVHHRALGARVVACDWQGYPALGSDGRPRNRCSAMLVLKALITTAPGNWAAVRSLDVTLSWRSRGRRQALLTTGLRH
jgi:hypothetical protein